MSTQSPSPQHDDQPDSPPADMPDTDEKKRQGPDEVTDPVNPGQLGGGRPEGTPSPDVGEQEQGGGSNPNTGGQSGAAQPRGDEPTNH